VLDHEPADWTAMTSRQVIDVKVNEGWRLTHPKTKTAVESGEVITLDVLNAAEWCGWGSATAVHGTYRVSEAL
jgi:hypothetical protein